MNLIYSDGALLEGRINSFRECFSRALFVAIHTHILHTEDWCLIGRSIMECLESQQVFVLYRAISTNMCVYALAVNVLNMGPKTIKTPICRYLTCILQLHQV